MPEIIDFVSVGSKKFLPSRYYVTDIEGMSQDHGVRVSKCENGVRRK
jgi:hypothetical protein